MLVKTLKKGKTLKIGRDVKMKVLGGGHVRLLFEAPKNVKIYEDKRGIGRTRKTLSNLVRTMHGKKAE